MCVRPTTLGATLSLVVVTAFGLGAQTPPPPAAKAPPSPTGQTMSLRGCLAAATNGDGFVLRRATSATDTAPIATTSAGAGTSATGDAPSGSITGQTPTGSTATGTASPTPAVGTPEASADPASPTYNRDVAAGTTGTVARPDSPRPADATHDMAIVATSGLDLRDHVGHTVEVTGKLAGARPARTATEATAGVRAPARKPPAPAPEDSRQTMLTLDVHALHDLGVNCSVQ
jgi:hypothetical protein